VLPEGITLARVDGETPADEMAAVHEASATAAYAHIFETPFPRDDAREKWASRRGDVWLARRGPVLVGFVTATGPELDGLFVTPAEAGAGIGTALLAAVPQARQLWVLEDAHASRRWYEKRGWRASGDRRHAYGVGELRYVR
jgi:GNAT superfamily N-acetyltransferase